jgi:hypothetical protein
MNAGTMVEATQAHEVRMGLPIDPAMLFADKKGMPSARVEKRRMKQLQKLGFLGKFLDTDERIIMVTTACSPFTAFEQLTMGAVVVYLKRALLVFTNKRLFHIPSTPSLQYRGSIAQVLYQDCKCLRVKGSALRIEYHRGRKERFLYISRSDRAIIKQFQLQAAAGEQPSARPQRNHLCPHCTHLLPPDTFVCPSCGLEFKNKSKSLLYSVLLPGGGYFYTGHHCMGLLDAIGETYLTVLFAGSLVIGLAGNPEALSVAIGVGVVLAIEKLFTVSHSRGFVNEFIPKKLKVILSGQPAKVQPSMPSPAPVTPQSPRGLEDILSVRQG